MQSSCMEEKHLENKSDKCFSKFYDKLKVAFKTRELNGQYGRRACDFPVSLPHLLAKKIRNRTPLSFPDLISLRLNFQTESKTNSHLPPLLDSANTFFQSLIPRIFLFFTFFFSSSEAVDSQITSVKAGDNYYYLE